MPPAILRVVAEETLGALRESDVIASVPTRTPDMQLDAALDIPCLTLRENTERPVTVELGSNRLVGVDEAALRGGFDEILGGGWKKAERPPLWDGRAGERIAEIVVRLLTEGSL